MNSIGILAYGSLICDPGKEISPLIVRRIPTLTPFPVEFVRLSKTHVGAPTVAPHSSGNSVKAEVLILADCVSVNEAKNLLWRRETRREGSGRKYYESSAPNAIIIRDKPGFCEVNHVLYTDFNSSGKVSDPDPRSLARAAISSVATAAPGKDGISYLLDLINAGVETALTPRYKEEILALTGTTSLVEALDSLRTTIGKA